MTVGSFLEHFSSFPARVTWAGPKAAVNRITPSVVLIGSGDAALEFAIGTAMSRPRADDLRQLWKTRLSGRPCPLVLAVEYPHETVSAIAIYGPTPDDAQVLFDLEPSQIARLALCALKEPNRHSALRFLISSLESLEGDQLPGVRNSGLLATHELRYGLQLRPDWASQRARGIKLLDFSGRDLIERLGFGMQAISPSMWSLLSDDRKRAICVFLTNNEAFDELGALFAASSPVAQALAVADREGLPWVILTRGSQIRIYSAHAEVGVGRKGRSETYVEINLALLSEANAAILPLLIGAEALTAGGSLEQIISKSADFAADLGARLRDRVYFETVPKLAESLANRERIGLKPSPRVLQDVYEQTLTILFRLLFVAYAEDKDLVPYRTNRLYQRHALKTLARDLADKMKAGGAQFDDVATDLWDNIRSVWAAIDTGNADWHIPAYNGGLFSSDPQVNRAGSALASVKLTNAELGPALTALLVDSTEDDEPGPVDFRSLSVTEFGTIYEGLLESGLSLAPFDLTVDQRNNYVAAKNNDQVVYRKGQVYFHHQTGTRKATGTFFTKSFAVSHLLENSLDRALDIHLERIAQLLEDDNEAEAAERLFDFRCVDLAMGSGHFLVAAIDRIEARLSNFLALRPLRAVTAELDLLKSAAIAALGDLASTTVIDHSSLLRRQVARRCVYGIDLNPLSVELARLAIWIHTFVPGLPLSFLDHNLINGNSLTGIASIDEAVDILDPSSSRAGHAAVSLFREQLLRYLDRAQDALRRLANVIEITTADIEKEREAHNAAVTAIAPAAALFDVLISRRLDSSIQIPVIIGDDYLPTARDTKRATSIAAELRTVHFPIAFPEVFVRDDPGFDCIIGNPPWDKVMFEAQQFWVSRAPGLNAMSVPARSREIAQLRETRPADAELEAAEKSQRERFQKYIGASYTLLGVGHYEYAKLFIERALRVLSAKGTLGYVLPRNALVAGGYAKLRERLVESSITTTLQARNRAGWIFDDVEARQTVVLLTRRPRVSVSEVPGVWIWADVSSVSEVQNCRFENALFFSQEDLGKITDTSVIPWFNSADDTRAFEMMRSRHRLASGRGWFTGINDSRWDFTSSGPHGRFARAKEGPGFWHILQSKHVYRYSIRRDVGYERFADPSKLLTLGRGFVEKRNKVVLDTQHPIVIFRYPARSDDSRTMIATVLPYHGDILNKGYVHGICQAEGTSPRRTLALLGYLNSFTCDWWTRRFVDRHLSKPIINSIPLPDWEEDVIDQIAEIVSALLIRNGFTTLPGAYQLEPQPKYDATSDMMLIAEIERLVLAGFLLTKAELRTILTDFAETEEACSSELRALMLADEA
jgi:hypothetical protein